MLVCDMLLRLSRNLLTRTGVKHLLITDEKDTSWRKRLHERSRWFLLRLATSLRVRFRHVSVGESLTYLAPLHCWPEIKGFCWIFILMPNDWFATTCLKVVAFYCKYEHNARQKGSYCVTQSSRNTVSIFRK